MKQENSYEVPYIKRNPAIRVVEDLIEYHDLTQAKVADKAGISRSLLNLFLKGKKRLSVDSALRLQAYFGIRASLLLELQADYEYSLAYHTRFSEIQSSVTPLEVAMS